MSTYSQYGTGFFSEDIVANEAYDGIIGAYRMVEENAINEHNIFEAIIGRDFAEAYCKAGAMNEAAYEAINESSASDVWENVKQFFIKIGEKILGILKNIKNKIQSVFIRDGKELVRKYSKTINDKMSKSQLTKMKFKWQEVKGESLLKSIQNSFKETEAWEQITRDMEHADMANSNSDSDSKKLNSGAIKAIENGNDYKPYTQDEKDDFRDKSLSKLLGKDTNIKSFAKDFDEEVFGDSEEKEGFTETILTECVKWLTTGKDMLKAFDNDETVIKGWIKEKTQAADRIKKAMTTKMANGEYGSNSSVKANAAASRVTSLGTVCSTVMTTAISAQVAATKKAMKQARATYIKAASTTTHESAFLEAVQEVSDYEVDMMFE